MKIPGPKTSFASIIDFFTEERVSKANTEPRFPLRPSAAGFCERLLANDLMVYRGLKEYKSDKQNAELTRIFSAGHALERDLVYQTREALKEAGGNINFKYSQQTLSFFQIPGGEFIEGQADGALKHNAWLGVIDFKTKKDKFDKAFKTAWDEIDKNFDADPNIVRLDEKGVYIVDIHKFVQERRMKDPYLCNNIYQLNMYFHSECNFLLDRGADFCSLIFLNKNDKRLREIRFAPSEALYEEVKEKFIRISECVDNNKTVEGTKKEFFKGSMACAFCKWNTDCWGESEDKIMKDWFKTLPNKKWGKRLSSFPKEDAAELRALYENFEKCQEMSDKLDLVQGEILKILDKNKCYKVTFKDNHTYSVKDYKSGGKGGKGRRALKRDK